MVVLSIEAFSKLIDYTENALDEADQYAVSTARRMTHEEVFSGIRGKLDG